MNYIIKDTLKLVAYALLAYAVPITLFFVFVE
jgi:hypothetical protein